MFPYSSMSPARLPRLRIGRGGTNNRRGDTSNAAQMPSVLRPVAAAEDEAEIGFGTVGNSVHVRDDSKVEETYENDSKDNATAEEMTKREKIKKETCSSW